MTRVRCPAASCSVWSVMPAATEIKSFPSRNCRTSRRSWTESAGLVPSTIVSACCTSAFCEGASWRPYCWTSSLIVSGCRFITKMCSGLQASACNMPWTKAEAILPNPKKPNVMVRKRLRFTTRSAKTLQAFGEEGSLRRGHLVCCPRNNNGRDALQDALLRDPALHVRKPSFCAFVFERSTHDHKGLRARAAVQRRSRGSATLPRHTRWKVSITSNGGRAGSAAVADRFYHKRESSGLGSRSRSMTTIVDLATAGRSVCISGLRLSVKLRENAQSGGPGYGSLFSRLLLAPASI